MIALFDLDSLIYKDKLQTFEAWRIRRKVILTMEK